MKLLVQLVITLSLFPATYSTASADCPACFPPPDSEVPIPAECKTNSGHTVTCVVDEESMKDCWWMTSGDNNYFGCFTPEETVKLCPENSCEIQSWRQDAPTGSSSAASDGAPTQKPEDKSTTDMTSTAAGDLPTPAPEATTKQSEEETSTTEQPAKDKPDEKPDEKPKKPDEKPKKPEEKPEKPDEKPEKSDKKPEKSDKKPEKSDKVPDKSNDSGGYNLGQNNNMKPTVASKNTTEPNGCSNFSYSLSLLSVTVLMRYFI